MFGRTQSVEDLRPEDFVVLRAALAERFGPAALGVQIGIIRSIFRYGYESELFEKPVNFGPAFKKPSARTMRQNRLEKGPRMFTPEQIQSLLKYAPTNLRAMLLLGANGGLGNTDIARITLSETWQHDDPWFDFPRQKTAVARRIPLWSETIDAINAVIAENTAAIADHNSGVIAFYPLPLVILPLPKGVSTNFKAINTCEK